MKATRSTTRLLAIAIAAFALLAAACGDSDNDTATTKVTTAGESTTAPPDTTADTAVTDTAVTDTSVIDTTVADTAAPNLFDGELTGLFSVDPGACTGGVAAGSYFRMVQPGGTAEAGPFIPNADSACVDTTYSLLSPGTDGGLSTGNWQAAPDPAFDATGNGLADMIVAPVTFFGVAFAAATDPNEAAPSVTAADGVLTGDLSAFTAYYGTGVFNQGAPKPDGSGPAPTGTVNVTDGSFMLEWTSLIVGGSFDGFTGVWHLEGTFSPMV